MGVGSGCVSAPRRPLAAASTLAAYDSRPGRRMLGVPPAHRILAWRRVGLISLISLQAELAASRAGSGRLEPSLAVDLAVGSDLAVGEQAVGLVGFVGDRGQHGRQVRGVIPSGGPCATRCSALDWRGAILGRPMDTGVIASDQAAAKGESEI